MASMFSFFFKGRMSDGSEPAGTTDQPRTNAADSGLSFEALADEVETIKEEFERYQYSFEEASVFISQQQAQINGLNAELQAKNVQANDHLAQIKDLKASQARWKAEFQNLQNQFVANERHMKKMKVEIANAQSQLLVSHNKYSEVRQQNEHLSHALRFEKFRSNSTRVTSSKWLDAYSVKPFVVVLVDGDAYSWSKDLFQGVRQAGHSSSPGSVAALRVRRQVQHYVLDHARIPASCEILARVFWNGFERLKVQRKAFADVSMLQTFMVDFTRDMPLFDYFDSGAGKEQADTKIRVNFELFVSNPHCHAVFLAVCTDNGFARMLRPFQYDHVARQKIVLISAGYKAPEIKDLPFEFVEWPDVFHPQVHGQALPRPLQKKPAKRESSINLFLAEMILGMICQDTHGSSLVAPDGLARLKSVLGRAGYRAHKRPRIEAPEKALGSATTSEDDVD